MMRRWPNISSASAAVITQTRIPATIHVNNLFPTRELGPLSTRIPITLRGSADGRGGRHRPHRAGSAFQVVGTSRSLR